MATLESVRLRDVYPSSGSNDGASKYTHAIENEAELETGSLKLLTGRLESWKEIAVYFSRSVRCVQRWERFEAMPVHRHRHRRGSSVYAYRSELDAWRDTGSAFVDKFANQG